MMTISTMTDSDILEKFGERVRELRQKGEWSQEAFAEECDLDRTYMGGIERGERNLGIATLSELPRLSASRSPN